MRDFELEIIAGLLRDDEFSRRTMHELKPEYFKDPAYKKMYETISAYQGRYSHCPSRRELVLDLQDLNGKVPDELLEKVVNETEKLDLEGKVDFDWLINKTEKYAKDRAMYIAVSEAAAILAGNDKQKRTPEIIPSIMESALAVSFETRVGHDYFGDAAARWDFYNADYTRVKFKIEDFNIITDGGLPNKTLTIPVAGTNVGKSLLLTDWATDWVQMGYNVLYISMEMAKERVGERIDAKILGVEIRDLKKMKKEIFVNEIDRIKIKENTKNLIIEEYPTRSASVRHFRKLLHDLRVKKNFKPDVILIDYLNIVASANVRQDAGSYQYIKAVAEEIRALAMEFDVPIVCPTQTNRTGQNHSDVSLEEVAESHGTSQTADLIFAMIRTDKLRDSNQILIKQLKNRFADLGRHNKFVVGVDISRMTLFPCNDQSAAGGDDRPVFDKSSAAEAMGLDFGDAGSNWNFG